MLPSNEVRHLGKLCKLEVEHLGEKAEKELNAKKRMAENLKNQLYEFFQRERELNLQTPSLIVELENKEKFFSLANEVEWEAGYI